MLLKGVVFALSILTAIAVPVLLTVIRAGDRDGSSESLPPLAIPVARVVLYPALLLAFSCFGWSLGSKFRQRGDFARLCRTCRWPALTVLLCSILLHLHEPHRFKIVYDEHSLAATAMNMHLNREASMPLRAHFIDGQFSVLASVVDKRPPAFPFLVSVLHDLTGYRPDNAMVLNAALTPVLLGLLCLLGYYMGGTRCGILAALLGTALPLLAMSVTSGGTELLNACGILALIVATRAYLRSGAPHDAWLMILIVVILAHVRYESILYAFVPVAAILLRWVSTRELRLTWRIVLSPLMLATCLLCQCIFWSTADQSLEIEHGETVPFTPANIPANLGHAFYFLFNFENDMPNSWLLSLVGCITAVIAAVYVGSNAKSFLRRPDGVLACALVAVPAGAAYVILLTYYWGQLDDPAVMRLSIPLHLFFVLTICAALRRALENRTAAAWIIGATCLHIAMISIPSAARATTTNGLFASRDIEWFSHYLQRQTTEDTFVLAESALPAIINHRPAIPSFLIKERTPTIRRLLGSGIYGDFIVFQRLRIDPATGLAVETSKHPIPTSYRLETLAEKRFRPNIISRISRLSSIAQDPDADVDVEPTSFQSEDELRQHLLKLYP
ncbi:MAG: hypothetical protein O2923_03240 [Verrucomicrobia bacterium]|nr:hypothetical protein [Verrucomicrobiota bacterium]MDA1086864.1 hypothetical protein [Verrucomicrobiota bacterium]